MTKNSLGKFPKTVLLDMDDVLFDFQTAAARVCGFTRQEVEARRTPGVWNITKAMGVTNEEMWTLIRKEGMKFWNELAMFHWTVPLLNYVEDNFMEWYILTDPDADPRCYAGKVHCLQKTFGTFWDRVIPFRYKHVLSKKDFVLVDDKFDNLMNFEFDPLNEFKPRGGCGILFPHNGNQLHRLADDPLPYVLEKLNAFGLQKRARRIPELSEIV